MYTYVYNIHVYNIYIYICIIVITVMNHSYYFVSMGCYDHPVCSTCLFATLQFIQSPFCCSPWFHCCAQEARSAILFSSDASSLSGVEFPGLMMYRGDEATENQTLSAQAAGQYIHLYIYAICKVQWSSGDHGSFAAVGSWSSEGSGCEPIKLGTDLAIRSLKMKQKKICKL